MPTRAPKPPGLSRLAEVMLPPDKQALLDAQVLRSQGDPAWRARKKVEATELLALGEIAERMEVLGLDMATDLMVAIRLQVPVPCMPPSGELIVAGCAELVLRYPPEILAGPLPGFALVRVVRPRPVWHSNISFEEDQSVCLGANVPTGLPLREAVLGAYAALTLQSITLDQADSAGIMNPAALRYWSEHTERIPLSTEPFLGPVGDDHLDHGEEDAQGDPS